MYVLVINCGSSSIKYKLYDAQTQLDRAQGLIERIGEPQARLVYRPNGHQIELSEKITDYEQGVRRIIELLTTEGDPPPLASVEDLVGLGHRVVHGGEAFRESVIVDADVLAAVENCCELAPLHNPANLAGIKAAQKIVPNRPHVGVFDTAFFQTMPPHAYTYAVPYEWYEQRRIRRYGFHGTSHRYVAAEAARLLGKPKPNLITLHLGNGCSMSCIQEGRAIDQTMGLTPLEGLVMGTRSGDIDPAIIFHMIQLGEDVAKIRATLEKKSGLLGVSGVSRDLRDIREAAEKGDQRAQLAIDVFAHRAKKYLGAFLAELGDCHAIVFTGGIGENAHWMRAKILAGLAPLGIEIDRHANEARRVGPEGPLRITTETSRTSAWVIPTDEELMIAQDTIRLVKPRARTESNTIG
ncbi:MAG: acetate kinase [Phycisphaerae bacterium]|nr:acetate kinase [Phycisphaerae bacterium]